MSKFNPLKTPTISRLHHYLKRSYVLNERIFSCASEECKDLSYIRFCHLVTALAALSYTALIDYESHFKTHE